MRKYFLFLLIPITLNADTERKVSELSDSIFINVEEDTESWVTWFIQPIVLFAILAIIMVAIMIFERGD